MNLKVIFLTLFFLSAFSGLSTAGKKLSGMVTIPAGEFKMGSKYGDKDEIPVHTVYLDEFKIDKKEVTNREYKKFIDADPKWSKKNIHKKLHDGDYLKLWNKNNYPKGLGDHPVVYVSWYAAQAYTLWRGKRLPTEAEWEKAASYNLINPRMPKKRKTRWAFGDTFDPQAGNTAHFHGLEIGGLWADWWGKFKIGVVDKILRGEATVPVGNFLPGANNLHDATGNVWEWCLDWYQGDAYEKEAGIKKQADRDKSALKRFDYIYDPSSMKDSQQTVGGIYRVIRGGSWTDEDQICRAANRYKFKPSHTYDDIGFRCVSSERIPIFVR
jgi:formylglycine-generating enzyme required for sulfatase activity